MNSDKACVAASSGVPGVPPATLLEQVNHGIRQPLMAISLYCAALREQVAGTPAANTAQQIQQAGACLQNLFEDLFLLSQLDGARRLIRRESLSIRALLNVVEQQFVQEYDVAAGSPPLTLSVFQNDVVARPITTDPDLFARLVLLIIRLFESIRPVGSLPYGQVLRLEAVAGQVLVQSAPANRQPALFDSRAETVSEPSRNPCWVLALQLAEHLGLDLLWQSETASVCCVRIAVRIE
jgi:hypothetical protein